MLAQTNLRSRRNGEKDGLATSTLWRDTRRSASDVESNRLQSQARSGFRDWATAIYWRFVDLPIRST